MITQAVVSSFLLEILQGVHTPQDTYRFALYTDAAQLTEATRVYVTRHEVVGAGYHAGGLTLSGYTSKLEGGVAFLDWDDPVWYNSTIAARAGLIYNYSKQNRAVAVLDLGKTYVSTNGSFTVTLPEANALDALIRIGA